MTSSAEAAANDPMSGALQRRPALGFALIVLLSSVWAAAFALGRHLQQLYAVLVVVAGMGAVVAHWASPRPPHPSGRERGLDVVLGIGAGLASLAATYALYPLVVGWVPAVEHEVEALYALAGVTPTTLALAAVVILAEEVIWRGLGLRTLQAHFPAWGPGVVVVAALPYALAQAGGGSALLAGTAFLFGVVWGVLAWWRRGRLLAPLIAHLLWTPTVLGLLPLR